MQVPVIPRTQPSTQGLAGPQVANDTDFGAGIGKALAGLGDMGVNLAGAVKQQQLAAQRFQAMRDFSAFQTNVGQKLQELQQAAPLGIKNFPEQAQATYQNMEADFLNKLAQTAPDLQGEFSTQTAAFGTRVAASALDFQQRQQTTYFENGIDEEAQKAQETLGNDSSLSTLDAQKLRVGSFIDASGLNAAQKIALKRKYFTAMEAITYKGQVSKDALDEATNPGQASEDGAAQLISTYGGDGAFNPNLTYEENQQQLHTRIQTNASNITAQIGSLDLWSALPSRAQSALISVADSNGGKLPDSVVEAVKSGDLANVVAAVQGLGGDRHAAEARVISGEDTTLQAQIDADPRFANLPYEDRLTLRLDAKREANAAVVEQQKAVSAANKQVVNSLFVALYDGSAGQTDIDQMRQAGILTDFKDIKQAQDILKNQTAGIALAQGAQQKLATGATFDPSSTQDKKMLNAYFGDKGAKALDSLDANYAAQTFIPLVRQAQDVPTAAAGQLTGMIRSADQQKALWGLDLLSQIQQASPKAFNQRFSKDTIASVNLYDVAKEYYPPDQLISVMQGGRTTEERQQTVMARQEAEKLLTTAENVKSLHLTQDFLDTIAAPQGGFMGIGATTPQLPVDPAAKAELSYEFQQLFIDEYPKYRDPTLAAQAATKLIQRDWGVSSVSGTPTLMKYPPEKTGYAPVNGSYDWIGKQVRDDLKLPADTTFQLIGDDQTRTEFAHYQTPPPSEPTGAGHLNYLTQPADEAPSYLVVTKDAQGVVRLATDENGKPRRVFFQQTPEMRAADLADFQKRQKLEVLKHDRLMQSLAIQHAIETGQPIPGGIIREWSDNQLWGNGN